MAFAPLFDPTNQFMTKAGTPLFGGRLYVYLDGTENLATVKNIEGTTIQQPIATDANGRATGGVFVSDSSKYRLEVRDPYNALLWSIAGMSALVGGSGGGSAVSITPTISSGTKIAYYSIDGETGELFAPNGGGGTKKIVGFVNTNGNITHAVTDEEISSGYCFETEKIAFTEINSNPFVAVFISFHDFWLKSKYSSIDIYATYEWVGAEYEIHLFKIDGTAISNNYFKDFEVFGQVTLPANKYLKLKIKWNLNGNASAGDNLLIKGNIMVASTKLLQSLQ